MAGRFKKWVKSHPALEEMAYWGMQGLYRSVPSSRLKVQWDYQKNTGDRLDLDSARTLSEKIQWMKLYYRDPLMVQCVDKWLVREYVAKVAGEQYLNTLYGVYDSVDEIDLDALPDSFVLKANHGSGWNIICEDKAAVDWEKELPKLRRWMKSNFYWKLREWAYKDVPPKIVCERYLKEADGGKLISYKFNCFHGEPVGGTVIFRDQGKLVINTYDHDWNQVPIVKMGLSHQAEFERPKEYEEMLELCRKLAAPFPYARIDMYCPDHQIIFGEITFYSGSGFSKIEPDEYNVQYGDAIDFSQTGHATRSVRK